MLGKIIKNRNLLHFIVASFFVTLALSFSTHLFEVPDENAHYATVHYLFDQHRMPTREDHNTQSIEGYKVEEIMGTLEGQNKYSFHPEYRIEQVVGLNGKYEDMIRSLNNPDNTSMYEGKRAAIYPPLYYTLARPFYYLASNGSLIDRVFSIRLLSVILVTITSFFIYQIGRLLTASGEGGFILASLFVLYPMTTYVGGGINSDNLHNLFSAIFVYLSLISIYKGWSYKIALYIGLVIGLDLLTKPQAYILIPIFLLLLVITYNQFNLKKLLLTIATVFLPILMLSGYQEIPKLLGTNPYVADSTEIIMEPTQSFVDFAKGYLRTHTAEMPVWYWGVFKWFGLTLPKPFWWLATRLLLISGIGIIIKIWKDFKVKQISKTTKFITFTLGANLIYVGALFWFDWQFYQQFGRSLGLQARYYMPLLSTQLALIYLGLQNLTGSKYFSCLIINGLLVFFALMHFAGFYTQLSGYYDFTSLTTFIDQLSQYKPWYVKGAWWYLWFILYSLGIITMLRSTLSKKESL